LTITRELNIIKRGHTALELRGHFRFGITEVIKQNSLNFFWSSKTYLHQNKSIIRHPPHSMAEVWWIGGGVADS